MSVKSGGGNVRHFGARRPRIRGSKDAPREQKWPTNEVSKWLNLPVLQPTVRQSNIGHLTACPRYFLYRDLLGIVRRGYKSAPAIGTMFHLAMGLRYKGADVPTAVRAVHEFVAATREQLSQGDGDSLVRERVLEQLDKDAVIAQTMSQLFWERVPFKESSYEVVAVEQDLELEIPEANNAKIGGVIDLVLYDRKRKGYFLVDHKTTSLRIDLFASTLPFDFQSRIYRLLVSEAIERRILTLRKAPILGFIHNVIRKPTVSVKAWQDPDSYLAEVRDWYDAKDDEEGFFEDGERVVFKSGPRKGEPKPRWEHSAHRDEWLESPPLGRFLTLASGPPLDAELRLVLSNTASAIRARKALENYPRLGRSTGMCTKHYGRPCEYVDLCVNHPCNWVDIIRQKFDVLKEETDGTIEAEAAE